MKDLRPVIGGRLRELRRGQGLSQERLAERSGLHWTYISDLERGQQTPTVDVMNRLARGLGVTLAKFFEPLDEPFRLRYRKQRSDTT